MSIIICPNCKSILSQFDKMLKCSNGHSFDFSKDGYINLLLANKKKKLNSGDSKLMMNAREAFLSKGHYDFLLKKVESVIQSLSILSESTTETPYLLDLACGSGYYTRSLLKDLNISKIGIDISKAGISKASKNDKKASYIVGSVFDLPIKDNAVDLVLNVFSPVDISEVKRILKPGGYFLKVIPAESHMKEVASLVYDTFIPHQSSIETDLAFNSDLQIIQAETIEKEINLFGKDLHNLISMTPYLYKFEKGSLEKLKELLVTFSFRLIVVRH